MAFDPEELIPIADLLIGSQEESRHRSATNRAYYAAFLIAKSMSGIDNDYDNSHKVIWDVFDSCFCSNGQTISDRGRNLKRKRVHADYNMNKSFSYKDAEYSVREARELIKEIKKLPPVKTTYSRK